MSYTLKRIGLVIFALTGFLCVGAWAAGEEGAAPPTEMSPLPSLTVRYADIQGQVLVASEREGGQEQPGARVRVQVRTPETGDVLEEVYTDDSGEYRLNRLSPGIYRLVVGRLRLNLLVESADVPEGELPKILLVIIPKNMTQFEP